MINIKHKYPNNIKVNEVITNFVLLFLLIIVSPNTTKQMITIFLLGASFSALLGIIQFLLQDTFVSSLFGLSYHDVLVSGTAIVGSSARWLRAYGSFSHPNIFGGYMLVASVYGVYMIHRGEKKYRAWYYLLSTICIVALFLSFSRSALLAGAVVLLIILSFFRTILHKTFILYLSALVVILIVLLYPLYISRVSIDSSHEIRSIGERVSSMHVAHDMIRSHFFFGIGMGNYSSALMSIVPDKPGWYYQPVHMVYALMQTEIGFVGCLLFFVSFLLFLYWIFEYNKNILQTLVIVCCFIFAVIAVFDHYLFSMYSGVILCAVTMAFATRNSVLPTD